MRASTMRAKVLCISNNTGDPMQIEERKREKNGSRKPPLGRNTDAAGETYGLDFFNVTSQPPRFQQRERLLLLRVCLFLGSAFRIFLC